MPNKRSASKELRKSAKRQSANIRIKTNTKQLYKEADRLLKEGKTDEAKNVILKFQKASDKAAKRGVIHQNKANRKKSDLMKKLAKPAA